MKVNVASILFFLTFMVLLLGQLDNKFCLAASTQFTFKLPQYDKFVMKNGLTVYLMEQHEVPLIYISMVFPAGAIKDDNQHGLAALTADGLLFGTKNYTKQQLEEQLDFIGASYNIYAAKENAWLSMSFVNTDLDIVFPILKEIVVHPIFNAVEFDKRKKRLLTELEQARERPASVIDAYFDKFLFGNHGYGNPVSGTRTSVSEISVEGLKTFYKKNYLPGQSAIAVVGDFNSAEMKKKVQTLFYDWKTAEKSNLLDDKAVPAFSANRVLLVNKDDATETRFRIGSPGIKRNNPDYVALQVINTILGGRFTSWLNDELRVNKGLTYGAGSSFSTYKNAGTFEISSYTKTETTIEAIDLALAVLNRMHEPGIDAETLTSAKNYIKGQFPPRYETAGSLASLLTSMFVYEYDESYINDFQKNVDELTVARARQIIDKYFPKEYLQFILIGKASEIRDKVSKYGEITEKEIKADEF